jgi:hypothetical protein
MVVARPQDSRWSPSAYSRARPCRKHVGRLSCPRRGRPPRPRNRSLGHAFAGCPPPVPQSPRTGVRQPFAPCRGCAWRPPARPGHDGRADSPAAWPPPRPRSSMAMAQALPSPAIRPRFPCPNDRPPSWPRPEDTAAGPTRATRKAPPTPFGA